MKVISVHIVLNIEVSTGVPKGSILKPLLFRLSFDDQPLFLIISSCIANNPNIALFADNTKSSFGSANPSTTKASFDYKFFQIKMCFNQTTFTETVLNIVCGFFIEIAMCFWAKQQWFGTFWGLLIPNNMNLFLENNELSLNLEVLTIMVPVNPFYLGFSSSLYHLESYFRTFKSAKQYLHSLKEGP